MSTVEAPVINPDDAALDYTLNARLRIARTILAQDITTNDPKNISNALKALDGVDKQVINKKRLVIEDKAANENAKTAKLIADVLTGVGGARPYRADAPIERSIPMLPDDIGMPQLVPGEMDIVTEQDSMESFMARRAAQQMN